MPKTVVKASRKSAVTQPKTAVTSTEAMPSNYVGLAFHVDRWVKEKAKAENTEPNLLVNMILNRVRTSERNGTEPDPQRTYLVCHWKGFDDSWERLQFDDKAQAFYLEGSHFDPERVKLSEALHWYGTKRELDCNFGELSWPGLNHLIYHAVWDLKEYEDPERKKRRDEAAAEFLVHDPLSMIDFVDCLRTISKHFEMQLSVSDFQKVSNEEVSIAEELAVFLTEGRCEIPMPEFSTIYRTERASDMPENTR